MNKFKLKSGKTIEVDFTSYKSIKSVKKYQWKEISQQLKEAVKIACSQMSGTEVHELLTNK